MGGFCPRWLLARWLLSGVFSRGLVTEYRGRHIVVDGALNTTVLDGLLGNVVMIGDKYLIMEHYQLFFYHVLN